MYSKKHYKYYKYLSDIYNNNSDILLYNNNYQKEPIQGKGDVILC